MRRTLMGASIFGLLLAFGACGIPEEEHNAVIKDLEKTKAELKQTQNKLSATESDKSALEKKINEVGGQKDVLAKRLGATKKEIEELRKSREAAEARNKVFKQLMERLQSMISSGKLSVVIRKGRMIVKMSDKILFDPGKTKLKEDGQAALQQLAAVLKDISDRDFLVAGHTDNVQLKGGGKYKSNWELSAARAVEVVKFLQNEGVDPKRLAAAGYSEFDPAGDNNTDDGKRENRRIEIVLMPNIEELPKIDAQ